MTAESGGAPGPPRADGLLARAGARTPGRRGGGRAAGVLARLALRRGGFGTLTVHDGGSTSVLGTGDPVVDVHVHDRRAYRSVLTAGSVGLAESYVAGWWETDDLTALVQVLTRRTAAWRSTLDRAARAGAPLLDAIAALARAGRPDRATDRRHIAEHYDVSNEFFALMLDETMTYSCAVFERPGVDLAEAQRAKLDRLCRKLDLQAGDHVLEIGSGWGSFALHAAGRYGCRVTTTTISDEQRRLARQRVEDAGLGGRVEVLGDDWRDLGGTYDKLVSIEMIEAVDWRLHDSFLAACAARLAPGGLAGLQAIVMEDRSFERAKHHRDFIRKLVFPGGCIPSVTALTDSLTRATDLRVVDLEDIGRHYAETLRRWASNLRVRADDLDRLGVPPRFRRLWDLYLAYCEAAFLERHISDVQLVAAKPPWRGRLAVRDV